MLSLACSWQSGLVWYSISVSQKRIHLGRPSSILGLEGIGLIHAFPGMGNTAFSGLDLLECWFQEVPDILQKVTHVVLS